MVARVEIFSGKTAAPRPRRVDQRISCPSVGVLVTTRAGKKRVDLAERGGSVLADPMVLHQPRGHAMGVIEVQSDLIHRNAVLVEPSHLGCSIRREHRQGVDQQASPNREAGYIHP